MTYKKYFKLLFIWGWGLFLTQAAFPQEASEELSSGEQEEMSKRVMETIYQTYGRRIFSTLTDVNGRSKYYTKAQLYIDILKDFSGGEDVASFFIFLMGKGQATEVLEIIGRSQINAKQFSSAQRRDLIYYAAALGHEALLQIFIGSIPIEENLQERPAATDYLLDKLETLYKWSRKKDVSFKGRNGNLESAPFFFYEGDYKQIIHRLLRFGAHVPEHFSYPLSTELLEVLLQESYRSRLLVYERLGEYAFQTLLGVGHLLYHLKLISWPSEYPELGTIEEMRTQIAQMGEKAYYERYLGGLTQVEGEISELVEDTFRKLQLINQKAPEVLRTKQFVSRLAEHLELAKGTPAEMYFLDVSEFVRFELSIDIKWSAEAEKSSALITERPLTQEEVVLRDLILKAKNNPDYWQALKILVQKPDVQKLIFLYGEKYGLGWRRNPQGQLADIYFLKRGLAGAKEEGTLAQGHLERERRSESTGELNVLERERARQRRGRR